MGAITKFLELTFIALKLYFSMQKEAKRNEIKNDPLDHFDRKFGSLHNNENLYSSDNKQNPKRNPTDTK